MNDSLKKRLKSFAWRLGGMVSILVLSEVAANLNLFELPIWISTTIGLVIGEVTKELNNRFGSIKN